MNTDEVLSATDSAVDKKKKIREDIKAVSDLSTPLSELDLPKVSKRGKGRPPKAEIKKKMKPGKVGRPVGDSTRARELCARMLVSEGERMLNTLIKMALTEGHPNQMASLKMCLDRALPISYFEDKSGGNNGGQGVVINISGINPPQIQSSSDAEDNIIDIEVTDESR